MKHKVELGLFGFDLAKKVRKEEREREEQKLERQKIRKVTHFSPDAGSSYRAGAGSTREKTRYIGIKEPKRSQSGSGDERKRLGAKPSKTKEFDEYGINEMEESIAEEEDEKWVQAKSTTHRINKYISDNLFDAIHSDFNSGRSRSREKPGSPSDKKYYKIYYEYFKSRV
jgi:hypothetical protein